MDEFISDEDYTNKSYFGTALRKRKAMHIERYRLIRMSKRSYFRGGGAFFVDADGHYCKSDGIRLKRYWRGQCSKEIKKRCNRRLRRNKSIRDIAFHQRGKYRRCTEFWWEYD